MSSLAFNRIPVIKPFVRHAKFFSQFSKRETGALVLTYDAHAPVSNLIRIIRPPAIPRFVVSIVVFSINRCACWSKPHIIQKILEIIPAFAHLYTPAAVMLKSLVARVVASCTHSYPATMLRASSHTVLNPGWVFSVKTPARFLAAVINVVAKCFNFFTAITQKQPRGLFVAWKVLNTPYGQKPIKAHSSQINCFHGKDYTAATRIPQGRRQQEYAQCVG